MRLRQAVRSAVLDSVDVLFVVGGVDELFGLLVKVLWVADLVACVDGALGDKFGLLGSVISREDVADYRKKEAGRISPWTESEF